MALSLASIACLAVVAWSICAPAALNRSDASAMACLDASSVPDRLSTWPPRRSMTLRASALASAREVAFRLAVLRDALQTTRPIAPTTTRMSTSNKPSMTTRVLTGKRGYGPPELVPGYANSGVDLVGERDAARVSVAFGGVE